MNDTKTLTAVVVLLNSKDTRLKAWANLLMKNFAQVWLVSGIDAWGKLDPDQNTIVSSLKSERPTVADVVLVHRSDNPTDVSSILSSIKSDFKRFVFSGPGVSSAEPLTIPIFRKTEPWDLADRDGKELFDYVAGKRTDMPACCTPEVFSFLCALAILCQGYLIARGRTDLLGANSTQLPTLPDLPAGVALTVCERKWWLHPFEGFALEEEICKECPEHRIPDDIRSLLDNLGGDDEIKVATALKGIQAVLNQ